MKKISILIPCYNEEDNVVNIASAVTDVIRDNLSKYTYEIVFIDNASSDNTRALIEEMCEKDKHIKAIFNITNFGQFNSPFYGITQCNGDCVIPLCCDFQDPPELIPRLVREWENGHKIVSAVKSSSKENPIVYFARTIYYRMIKNMSTVGFIEHFTGFGLYDQSFVELLRHLDDNIPFMRGIVAEYGKGFNMITIEYEQQARAAGKSKNNFYSLYDAAMLSFTSYTKVGLRLATFIGMFVAGASFVIGIIYLVYKFTHWYNFNAGVAPLTIGMFFLSGTILLFLGFMGEYILNINTRVIHRPVVVEEKRINFSDGKDEDY